MINGNDWENMIIFLSQQDAIEASNKYPNSRIEIFSKSVFGYQPTYDFYKHGTLYKKCE
jgi:hypothetical protein